MKGLLLSISPSLYKGSNNLSTCVRSLEMSEFISIINVEVKCDAI